MVIAAYIVSLPALIVAQVSGVPWDVWEYATKIESSEEFETSESELQLKNGAVTICKSKQFSQEKIFFSYI